VFYWFGQMLSWLLRVFVVAGIALVFVSPTLAEEKPSFGDLLERAQAQAAAGHRWLPPGDNMTETIETMMDLIPSATPKQLAELSSLLQGDASQPPLPGTQLTPAARPVMAEKTPAPVLPASAAPPVSPPPAATSPSAALPTGVSPVDLPSAGSGVGRPVPRAVELLARGQEAERAGDVSGARRFYATAAGQGSAMAARSLGRLYDPAYLNQSALGGIDPDPALARHWYERAVAMGDTQAAPLLEALAAR
jgi:hypothetical protein